MKYFLDTYTIFEIIKGNPKYKSYLDYEFITFKINLAELCYGFIKEGNESAMNYNFSLYSKIAVELPEEIIIEAMKFRFKNKNKSLSYIDCLGYIYAKRNKMKFLTGDRQFKSMDNVEFVK